MQACFSLFSAQHFRLRENVLNRNYMQLIDPLLTYFSFTFNEQTLCLYVRQPDRFFKVIRVRIRKATGVTVIWVSPCFGYPRVSGIPVFWVSPCFGYPRTQIPSVLGTPVGIPKTLKALCTTDWGK